MFVVCVMRRSILTHPLLVGAVLVMYGDIFRGGIDLRRARAAGGREASDGSGGGECVCERGVGSFSAGTCSARRD